MNKLKFVAHRGESAIAPENTVEAYVLAWKNGKSWGAETDVYLSKDHVLMCCHDESTLRTCGVDWPLRNHTVAELKTLDAGNWKGAQWTGCRIPTLREVLTVMPPDGHLFVEIKSAGNGLVEAFEESRTAAGVKPEQITFISFHGEELKIIREQLPQYKTLLLIWLNVLPSGRPEFPAEELIARLQAEQVNGVDMGFAEHCVDAAYIKKIKDAGFEVHIWTVDDISEAVRLSHAGVDSITTNRPTYLAENWPE